MPAVRRPLLAVLAAALAALALPVPQPAAADAAADLAAVRQWMHDQQFTSDPLADGYGAIRVHHTPGCYGTDGKTYYRVQPYFSSLAVSAYIRAGAADGLDYAERWITWYLASPRATGPMYDWWYTAGGHDGSKAPPGCLGNHYDSDDAYAATFLGAVGTYVDAGGSRAVSFLSGREAAIQGIAQRMIDLQKSDGLTIALTGGAKYLEDNAEVYWGFKAAARIETTAYGNGAKAATYEGKANLVGNGIYTTLFDTPNCNYRWAESSPVVRSQWDPSSIASAWPVLFGVAPGTLKLSRTVMTGIAVNFPNWPNEKEVNYGGQLQVWPAMTLAAQWSGDTARAAASAAYIRSVEFPSGYTPAAFPWIWTVADGGWMALYLAGVADPGLPAPTYALPSCGNAFVPSMTSLSCTQAAAWSASVTCTMAAGDGDADPVRFAITWGDGASETTAAYATPATVVRPHTMASEGVKTISVKASDTPVPSWSSGTATATVSVDLLPPALSVSAPAPGKIYRGCTNAPGVTGPATEIQRGCLSFSASDAVSGLDHVAISAPNACAGSVPASVSGTGPWTFDYPLCSTAATMVSVTAFDVAGHSTTQARSVRDVV